MPGGRRVGTGIPCRSVYPVETLRACCGGAGPGLPAPQHAKKRTGGERVVRAHRLSPVCRSVCLVYWLLATDFWLLPLELIPEAEHHAVDVAEPGRGLERLGHQLVVDGAQAVPQATGRVGRRRRQRLGVDQALPDAPVAVQQVAEVGDVDAELERVPPAGDVLEDVLRDAQVGPEHHRQEHRAAHGVLAAVLAEIGILGDVGSPRPPPAPPR